MKICKENLQNYKLQLQQVIELTRDLIKTQLLELKAAENSAGGSQGRGCYHKGFWAGRATSRGRKFALRGIGKVGDKCLAVWSEDGQYYEATIEDITEDGEEVSVVFDSYKNSDVTTMAMLREIKGQQEIFT
ncbi:hypothetical protein L9F63_027063, partial [Diploptera punctata]